MTQLAKLLTYLEAHGSITTLEAMERLRILRLSERCRELERLGILIEHKPEKTPGGAREVRYRLQKVAYG